MPDLVASDHCRIVVGGGGGGSTGRAFLLLLLLLLLSSYICRSPSVRCPLGRMTVIIVIVVSPALSLPSLSVSLSASVSRPPPSPPPPPKAAWDGTDGEREREIMLLFVCLSVCQSTYKSVSAAGMASLAYSQFAICNRVGQKRTATDGRTDGYPVHQPFPFWFGLALDPPPPPLVLGERAVSAQLGSVSPPPPRTRPTTAQWLGGI